MSLFILYINIILLLKVILVNLTKIKYLSNFNSYINEINLVIKGDGNKYLLNSEFTKEPSSVFINGNSSNSCSKSCSLTGDTNNITLKFSELLTSCENMFQNLENLIEVDLSNFDVSQVTSMANMFKSCTNLKSVHLSNSNTYSLVNISYMFFTCSNLEIINFGNINTSSVKDAERLFNECKNLNSIDISNLDFSKVTSMFAMFHYCQKLETINFGNINTSSVANMRSLFNKCFNLKSIDLTKFDTSKVTTFQWMFDHCTSLTSIDISHFNTSNVEIMYGMFSTCSKLEKINFGNINTSSVKDVERVFDQCISLNSIDLSNLDFSKVTSMFAMFHNCSNLEKITFGNINTSSVVNMRSLFNKCSKIEAIDLSNFDTSKVTTFQWMFEYCSNLKYLNLSHFDTSKISNIYGMFLGCDSLIYLNLYSFKLNNTVNKTNVINNINPNVKYCINDNDTKTLLLGNNVISDCSGPCFQKNNKKVDIFNNTCIESCINNGFDYEYNTICLEKCPDDSYTLFCDEGEECNNNAKECFKPEIKYYYLDSVLKKFKKCYDNCKYCDGKGNETINNCKECINNYKFYTNPYTNNTNCYQICNNYYYFDLSNNFTCTNDLKCPNNYNKLIFNKNQCIDECKNDDIYKYEYNNKCYKKCPDNTFINDTNNYICIYKLINNENITQKLITTSSDFQIVYECKNEETLNNNCNFLNIENETEIMNIIQENIQSLFDQEEGKSQVIKGGNDIIYQLTNGKNEKELLQGDFLNNQNLTILDLGKCEEKLRVIYNISDNDSLIYLKKDKINVKPSEKNVQYEIFEPYNYTKLNLSICNEEKVNIYFPLILSEETRNTYENMKKLGYNMFNINDPFYQDLCTPYKTENDTDMPLSARKDYIYNNKDSQCQSNCQFSSYLLNSLYINCSCNIEQKEEKGKEIKKFSGKTLYEIFYDLLKYANFKILTCYNLTFDIYIFKNNIGN